MAKEPKVAAKDRAPTIAAWAAIIAALGNVGALAWTQKPWWIAGEEDRREIEEGRKAIRELEMIRFREQLMLEARNATTTASAHPGPLPPPPSPVKPKPVRLMLDAAEPEMMAMSNAPEQSSSIWSLIRISISAVLFLGAIGFFIYKRFKKPETPRF